MKSFAIVRAVVSIGVLASISASSQQAEMKVNRSGTMNRPISSAEPQFVVTPIPGVGVVVKKNPRGKAVSVVKNDIENAAVSAGAIPRDAKLIDIKVMPDNSTLELSIKDAKGNSSVIQLQILDVADGSTTPSERSTQPIPGIGVVVKKNPGGKAFMVPGKAGNTPPDSGK